LSAIEKQFEQALLEMDRISARNILEQMNPENDALGCVDRVIVPALESIGLQWEKGSIPLAQVYMGGRICEELVDQFLPPASPLRIVQPATAIAILEDFHTLGKSIVYSALRARGIEVEDFGTVDIDGLVKKTIDNKIKILLISVLMFNSARNIKEVTRQLKEKQIDTKVIVGGAPFRFDEELWKNVGADAVGINTAEALQATQRIIEELS